MHELSFSLSVIPLILRTAHLAIVPPYSEWCDQCSNSDWDFSRALFIRTKKEYTCTLLAWSITHYFHEHIALCICSLCSICTRPLVATYYSSGDQNSLVRKVTHFWKICIRLCCHLKMFDNISIPFQDVQVQQQNYYTFEIEWSGEDIGACSCEQQLLVCWKAKERIMCSSKFCVKMQYPVS